MHFSNFVVYVFLRNTIYRLTAHFYSHLVCEAPFPYIAVGIRGVEVDTKGHALGRGAGLIVEGVVKRFGSQRRDTWPKCGTGCPTFSKNRQRVLTPGDSWTS